MPYHTACFAITWHCFLVLSCCCAKWKTRLKERTICDMGCICTVFRVQQQRIAVNAPHDAAATNVFFRVPHQSITTASTAVLWY